MDYSVVILEHVHLIDVLQLLHAFGEKMVRVSIIQIWTSIISKKQCKTIQIASDLLTEFLNGLLEFLVLIHFLVVNDLFGSSLTSYKLKKRLTHSHLTAGTPMLTQRPPSTSSYVTAKVQKDKNWNAHAYPLSYRLSYAPLPPIWVWPNLAASLALASLTSWSWSIFPYNSYRLLYIY